ncbi:hypothetical protein EVAR_84626_1 [Eumeta japonica]|uniref:Uncharacterized protein n=1 Tax=Eumeta variegata TaxID=151549 RepID=A0A4C1V0F1_EUMVA|nr:hypothetical protein EVAR_84626_1 [Eumeta japonica]
MAASTGATAQKTRGYPPIVVENLPNRVVHFEELRRLIGHAPKARLFGKGIQFLPKSDMEFRTRTKMPPGGSAARPPGAPLPGGVRKTHTFPERQTRLPVLCHVTDVKHSDIHRSIANALRDAYAAVRVTLRWTAPDLLTRDQPAPTVKAHIWPVTGSAQFFGGWHANEGTENGLPQRRPDDRPDHHRSTIDIDIDGTKPINGDDRTPPPSYGCYRTSDKTAQLIQAVGRGRAHCGGKTKKRRRIKVQFPLLPPSPRGICRPSEGSVLPSSPRTSDRDSSDARPRRVPIQGSRPATAPPLQMVLLMAEPQREMPPTILTSKRSPALTSMNQSSQPPERVDPNAWL